MAHCYFPGKYAKVTNNLEGDCCIDAVLQAGICNCKHVLKTTDSARQQGASRNCQKVTSDHL